MKKRKRLLILASGTEHNGGSGVENLIRQSKDVLWQADIIGVVSHHPMGGVKQRMENLYDEGCTIPFIYLTPPFNREQYQWLVEETTPDFIALSGWVKPVIGLDPRTTFNIHPGPLPNFGGKGMYGSNVHTAVFESFRRGEITHTEVCMHFVTENYDEGPVFFRRKIPLDGIESPETLATIVNNVEHFWQPIVTAQILCNAISWDGHYRSSLVPFKTLD